MRRRRLLQLGGGAFCTILAGCSSGPDGDEPSDPATVPSTATPPAATTAPPTASPTATRTHREAFAAFLADQGITVETLEAPASSSVVTLDYVSRQETYDEIGAQIGTIAGGFFRQLRAGWERERLEATILDPSQTPRATWYARAAWFREFQNQEIPAEELSFRVLDTLEPVE